MDKIKILYTEINVVSHSKAPNFVTHKSFCTIMRFWGNKFDLIFMSLGVYIRPIQTKIINSIIWGKIPSIKLHWNPTSSFGDQTCGQTMKQILPLYCGFILCPLCTELTKTCKTFEVVLSRPGIISVAENGWFGIRLLEFKVVLVPKFTTPWRAIVCLIKHRPMNTHGRVQVHLQHISSWH